MQFYDGWFDVGYGLVIVGLIISLWASWNVKSTFRRYQNDRNSRGLTAAQVAQIRDIVLSKCQVTAQNITIVEVK